MPEEIIQVTRQPNYVVIALNRPEKRNALNQPILEELDKALASVEDDKSVRALLLRGNGSSFCSGIDLKELHATAEAHNPTALERAFERLERFPVPTVAAIQGAALAGGLELAAHCDIRIASENAKLGMPVARLGLIPPYDFTRKLIETCGAANTAYVLYTAGLIDARRSLEMGLVHEVVADGNLQEAAIATVEKIAANAPLSLRAMKATIRRCMSESFQAYHEDLLELTRAVRSSEDAKEGVKAFVAKRKPVWRAL